MPETSVAPARFARRTNDWSKETNLAPDGLLLRCIASANAIPWTVSARAADTDSSSSTCTFLRPSNLLNASAMAACSNSYRLRRTQPVSSNTVLAIQIGPAANRDCAAAACLGSSPVSSRTRTLVSIAIMTSNHLAPNGITHLRQSCRFVFRPQTADDLVELGSGKEAGGTQQNSIAGFFHRELSARSPGTGSTYILGHDDLALGGQ